MRKKLQTPNSNLQRNSKFQDSRIGDWKINAWPFSGIWRLAPCSIVLLALSFGQLWAQTNTAKPSARSNRFLLIVDTSRVMERRADATLRVVQGLLVSAMNGQFRRGDTFGIWTFNEELYAGRFPLQQWSAETQKA